MANQPESSTWATGVYQWEATDPAQGGLGGVMNTPILQLASRTRYLKDQVDALSTSVSGFAPLTSPAFLGNPTAPTAAQFDNDTSIATTAFVQRALGNASGVDVYTSGFTLTAAQSGKTVVYYSSSDGTGVLPLVSACPAGSTFRVVNGGTGTLTLQRQGSDLIIGIGTVTTITLGSCDSVTLENVDRVNQWIVSGGSVTSRYSYSGTLKASTSGTYSGMSVGYATSAGNAGTVGGWSADDLRSFTNVLNKPTGLAGYGITDAVEKGTGTGQGSNAVKIGWASGALRVQVDNTDFASTWPINVTGSASNIQGYAPSDLWRNDQASTWANGYKLPNGLIIQFVTVYVGTDSSAAFSYPAAFPNDVLGFALVGNSTTINYSSTVQAGLSISGATLTGATIVNDGLEQTAVRITVFGR